MKKSLVLRLIFGAAILIVILYKIGIGSIVQNISEINLYYLPAFIIVLFASLFIGSLNIKLLSLPFNRAVSVLRLFRYYIIGWSLSLITPGRVGEFSIIYFLRKEKIQMGQGAAVALLDKLISLIVICVFAVIGFTRNDFFTLNQSINILALLAALFIAGFFFIFTGAGRNLIKKYILRSYSVKFEGFSSALYGYLKNFKKEIALNLSLTIIKFGLSALLVYVFFFSFGEFTISFYDTLLIYCITALISLIPVSINGLGIREGISLYLFGKIGVSTLTTGSVFITLLIFNYIIGLIAGTALINKRIIKEESQNV
jgi:uncharacterized protein (TIRG00374 family)